MDNNQPRQLYSMDSETVSTNLSTGPAPSGNQTRHRQQSH